MRALLRSRPQVLLLGYLLLGVLVIGAIIVAATKAQADSAQEALNVAQAQAETAAIELEDGQGDVRLAENRLDSARTTAQQKAGEFADARFYCDVTGNAIVFDDVRWCDVSAQRLSELEDADTDVARLSTELQILEDALPQLEADVEAALDEATSSNVTAQSTASLLNIALVVWIVLSAVLASAVLLNLVWGRQTASVDTREG